MSRKLISFIIPCYGSEHTIASVIAEIGQEMGSHPEYSYEIVAVNDASPDNVWTVLTEIAADNTHVRLLNLARNMGKHCAVMAGLNYCSGDIVVLTDDDGQCPMNQLWRLIDPLDHGADVAIARYPVKKQSLFKNFGSRINARMAEWLIGKPKDLELSNFLAMKRFICREIIRYPYAFAYLDGIILRTTKYIVNVEMEERERLAGETGYTFCKSVSLWLNGFTSFSVKPLRLASLMGCVTACLGALFGIYVIIEKLLRPDILAGYSSLMAVLLFLGGMIMMLLGMLGEYIGRLYICQNKSPQFVIRDQVNFDADYDDTSTLV